MTLVSIHQPDLLPYSGFWFKMAVSDVFVVARHDQFQNCLLYTSDAADEL